MSLRNFWLFLCCNKVYILHIASMEIPVSVRATRHRSFCCMTQHGVMVHRVWGGGIRGRGRGSVDWRWPQVFRVTTALFPDTNSLNSLNSSFYFCWTPVCARPSRNCFLVRTTVYIVVALDVFIDLLASRRNNNVWGRHYNIEKKQTEWLQRCMLHCIITANTRYNHFDGGFLLSTSTQTPLLTIPEDLNGRGV